MVAKDHRKDSNEADLLAQSYNHTNLLYITESKDIIFGCESYRNDEIIKFNPQDYDLSDELGIIDLPEGLIFKPINEDTQNHDSLVLNIIPIKQWDLAHCQQALKDVLRMMQDDMDCLIIDNNINIYFELPSERLNDEEFYKRLSSFGDKITDDLSALIELFITLPKSERYYHDEETTFLHYAMKALTTIDERYTDLFIHYMTSVDMDHDVSNADIFAYLVDNKDWNELRAKLVFAGNTSIGSQYTHDLFSDYWEEQGLKDYINQHYDVPKLKALFDDIFSITNKPYDDDDIGNLIEEFQTYQDSKVFIDCLTSMRETLKTL